MRSSWAPPVVAILLLLALWEAVVRAGLIPETSIPPATSAIGELATQLAEARCGRRSATRCRAGSIGLGIAVAARRAGRDPHRLEPLGLPRAARADRVPAPDPVGGADPARGARSTAPGLQSKVFLATFASFWPLLIQTIYGVQDVDPVATDTARSFQLGRLERMWRITVPSAVPYIATGIRISSAVALILCVTAELVIGSAGLGREINSARSGGNIDLMYAMIVATGLLGWLLNIAATMVERRVLHWHPSQRGVPA